MSAVSNTDLKLFLNLSNPDKVDAEANGRIEEDDEDDGEEGEEGEEGEYDEEDGEEEEDGDEDGGLPNLLPSSSSAAPSRAARSRVSQRAVEEDAAPAPEPMSPQDIEYHKTTVLLELDRLKAMGCKLTREYTIDDNLEEMEYEARRHVLHLEEQNNVNTLKDGMRLFVSGCEFANGKFGPFLNLDGFSQSVSNDLGAGKYNLTLSKLHRKYFKTPGQSSPEMELAFSLMGAAAFHHFQRSYMNKMMPNHPSSRRAAAPPAFPPAADDDSDEDLPPSFST